MATMHMNDREPHRSWRGQVARIAPATWGVVFAAFLIWGATTAAHSQGAPAATPPTGTPPTASPPGGTQAAVAKAAIDIGDGWARATPGNATTAAVYLRITNAGKEGDTLIGVESPNAQHAMVHTTTVVNGTASMAMTPSIAIPARTITTFAPNGRHIMLEGLKAPLREGESFIITLNFTKAGKVSATVKVVSVAATGPTGAH